MYFYYAVISKQAEYGSCTTDSIGYHQTRVDVIKYIRDELKGQILNLIELTEEEYDELVKKYETEN